MAMERVKNLRCWSGAVQVKSTGEVKDELGLGDGRTNQNFIVTDASGARFFVRIGADLPFFGVSRAREHAAGYAAASAGVAPPVVYTELPDSFVVEFVNGRALTEDDVHTATAAGKSSELLQVITDSIRKLHAAPVPPELSAFIEEVTRTAGPVGWGGPHLTKWLAYAEEQNYSRVPLLDGVRDLIAKLEAAAASGLSKAEPARFCHFDLLADNFVMKIGTSDVILVDFEYCSPGQPLMDLAVLAMGCSLTPEEERNLLSSYLEIDVASEEQVYSFQALKVLAAIRETLWGTTAELSKSSALTMEEAMAYTDMNFAKLEQMRANFENCKAPAPRINVSPEVFQRLLKGEVVSVEEMEGSSPSPAVPPQEKLITESSTKKKKRTKVVRTKKGCC